MTDRRTSLTRLTANQEALLLLVISALLVALLFGLEATIDIPLIQTMDVVAGTLLTSFIALIYFRQNGLLRIQTDIEDSMATVSAVQARVMKRNLSPVPIVQDYYLTSRGDVDPRSPDSSGDAPLSPEAQDEKIVLEISNEADAPATNLRIACLVYTDTPPSDGDTAADQAFSDGGTTAWNVKECPLSINEHYSGSGPEREGAVLPADANGVTFQAVPRVETSDGGIRALSHCIWEAISASEEIRVGFALLYDTVPGDSDYILLNTALGLAPDHAPTDEKQFDLEVLYRCGGERDVRPIWDQISWDPPEPDDPAVEAALERLSDPEAGD